MLPDDTGRIGFGTYQLVGEDGTAAVEAAIDVGYRHLDTAHLYGNEDEVGRAIDRSDVDREDLFVATKVAHFEEPSPTPDYVRETVAESFDLLGVDTIDLLYHHWPREQSDVETVLPVIEEFVDDGDVRHLGVSNYRIEDLELARDLLDVPIAANQVEMHPLLPQTELREYLDDAGIDVVAYSPIAQGAVFDVPAISDVAAASDATEAQVSLAWVLAKGAIPIPRTSDADHARSNFDALDLELDDDAIARIDGVERTHRCEDPDWMEW